jgi:outer membrane protein assembly factor BamB
MTQRQCVGVLLALAAMPARAADWPRFRGPNGTGIVADADLPVRWSDNNGILWKAAIAGVGHSSPVIGGGKLFAQSASADGRERWLLCLDAATGKRLWQQAAPGHPARIHRKNSLSSSTPALDGRRVFATFWDGSSARLCAFDLEGKRLWEQDLGGFESQHGFGLSPIAVEGKVIVNYDQDGSAELLAFDAATGKPAWRVPRRPFRACYSTPLVRDLPGGSRELVVVSTDAVTGYDAATGRENWHCNWPRTRMPLRTVGSPVVADGLIIAAAGDGSGDRLCIAVKPGAGDVTATNLAWQDRKAFPYVPSILAWGQHVYNVNDAGVASCHVARSGEILWQERLGGSVTASPVLAGGKVYAITDRGDVVVFTAATTFKLLGRSSLGEAVSATPAIADNRLYIRGSKHLFCIGKEGAAGAHPGAEGTGGGGSRQ